MFSCEFCEITKNTFSYRTRPVAASADGRRNKANAKKGCHYQSRSLSRRVFEQHFYRSQERWGQQTNDQFKETEQFYSLSSFQNGGFVSGKGTTFAKRLDVQRESKGCLLLYTYPSEFIEELTFQMG